MKINHRHYTLMIFALASIAFSILAYVFIYKRAIKQAEYYVIATREVESEKNRDKYEEDIMKIFELSKEDRVKVETFIARDDRIVDFIEKVEEIGAISKTTLMLSSISKEEGKIKAKVNVTGSWGGVMSALMLMENMGLQASLSNASLNSLGNTSSTSWDLSLDIEAPTIKQNE